MMHPIIAAAREFQKDEARREKRGQALRMPGDGREAAEIDWAIETAESPSTPENVESPEYRRGRGELAVGIFGYVDSFDEQAATVITDILHAAAARGFSPQAVLDQAALYYAEERTR